MRGLSILLLMGVSLLGAGCAGSSLLRSYPSRIDSQVADLCRGKPSDDDLFNRPVAGRDKTLYLMERGRIRQLELRERESKRDYVGAIQSIRAQDDAAMVSLSGVAGQAGAILLNDNAIAYDAAGYERVMLRYAQAMNYLMDGDLIGGRVEIVNLDRIQEDALKLHARELEKVKADALAEGRKSGATDADVRLAQENSAAAQSVVNGVYAGMNESAGAVKDSFQNAAAYYLSGLIYESLRNWNDAYISYRRALEMRPASPILQRDTMRIALLDQRDTDLRAMRQRFGYSAADVQALKEPVGAGRVVIFCDGGFVAEKEEVKIPIPVFTFSGEDRIQGFSAVAFPIYQPEKWAVIRPVIASFNLQTAQLEVLTELNDLAVQDLKEQVPAMVVRQGTRLVMRTLAVKAAEKQNAWAGLALSAGA